MSNNNINDLLQENKRRLAHINATFNPITGQGSIGARKELILSDVPFPQHIPLKMWEDKLIVKLSKMGSIKRFITDYAKEAYTQEAYDCVFEQLVRIRILHDFPFWSASLALIKRKGGGQDMLFRLNRPQRILIVWVLLFELIDKW